MSVRGLLVDPIQYSQSYHHKNYMADGKENYYRDLESERVKLKIEHVTFPLYYQDTCFQKGLMQAKRKEVAKSNLGH